MLQVNPTVKGIRECRDDSGPTGSCRPAAYSGAGNSQDTDLERQQEHRTRDPHGYRDDSDRRTRTEPGDQFRPHVNIVPGRTQFRGHGRAHRTGRVGITPTSPAPRHANGNTHLGRSAAQPLPPAGIVMSEVGPDTLPMESDDAPEPR